MSRYQEEKDYSIGKDAFEFFFNCIGYFNHHAYFTKELWRKVEGFKNEDEGEVKCAFLSLWSSVYLGIKTMPLGACWSWMNCDDESFEKYKQKWMPLYEDYTDWQIKQR